MEARMEGRMFELGARPGWRGTVAVVGGVSKIERGYACWVGGGGRRRKGDGRRPARASRPAAHAEFFYFQRTPARNKKAS